MKSQNALFTFFIRPSIYHPQSFIDLGKYAWSVNQKQKDHFDLESMTQQQHIIISFFYFDYIVLVYVYIVLPKYLHIYEAIHKTCYNLEQLLYAWYICGCWPSCHVWYICGCWPSCHVFCRFWEPPRAGEVLPKFWVDTNHFCPFLQDLWEGLDDPDQLRRRCGLPAPRRLATAPTLHRPATRTSSSP
jgi:hypothetical protein